MNIYIYIYIYIYIELTLVSSSFIWCAIHMVFWHLRSLTKATSWEHCTYKIKKYFFWKYKSLGPIHFEILSFFLFGSKTEFFLYIYREQGMEINPIWKTKVATAWVYLSWIICRRWMFRFFNLIIIRAYNILCISWRINSIFLDKKVKQKHPKAFKLLFISVEISFKITWRK